LDDVASNICQALDTGGTVTAATFAWTKYAMQWDEGLVYVSWWYWWA